jgi:hypothetical protein
MICQGNNSPCSMLRMRGGRLHEGGVGAYTRAGALRSSNVMRPSVLSTAARILLRTYPQTRAFRSLRDLEQRTIEEAGYTVAVLRSGDLRKIVVVRAGNQP